MYLKRITVRNMQSIREMDFHLPPTGLVVFTGNNSNGKSIVGKVTIDLITGNIRSPRRRGSDINRKAPFGEIEYERDDGTLLLLHLARDAASTYVSLRQPGRDVITRYLSDKTYKQLINDFGWHYDTNTGISLNYADDNDALLFYGTPNKTNGSILQTITTDSKAEMALENGRELLKGCRQIKDNWTAQIRVIGQHLQTLQIEDIDALTAKRNRLEYYQKNLACFRFTNLPEIKKVPNVSYLSISFPRIPEVKKVPSAGHLPMRFARLPEIKYPTLYQYSVNLPDICKVYSELKAFQESRCPTCGRRFCEHVG